MFGRGNRGNASPEGIQALEVRLSRLADEVQSAVRKVEALEAREVARAAAIAEATDKLQRLVERGRKYAALRRDRDGDAGDGDEPGLEREFDALYSSWRNRGVVG